MNNTQLWLAIGIPTGTILVNILLNQLGQNRIENRLTVIESDLRRFWQLLGEHSGKIEALERK